MFSQTSTSGVVVSKLGIEACACGDVVTGVLCLKVNTPSDGTRYKIPLLTGWGNMITSSPLIYPFRLSVDDMLPSHYETARRLLSPPTTSRAQTAPQAAPSIELSNDQVVLVGQTSSHGRSTGESSRRGSMSRVDWMIILPFELGVTRSNSGAFSVRLPLPKCLDNVLRLQIASAERDKPMGEVSILTEPKILPVPASTFDSPSKAQKGIPGTPKGKLEQWNDSKDTTDESDEDDACWLEGRFQSTESLSLEWVMASTMPSARLLVEPRWRAERSSINVHFEALIPTLDQILAIETVIPNGWVWSSLSIAGDELMSWRSFDGHSSNIESSWRLPDKGSIATGPALAESENEDDGLDLDQLEDSFTTLRSRSYHNPIIGDACLPTPPVSSHKQVKTGTTLRTTRASSSHASLLRQTMPKELERMDDFSFEINALEEDGPRDAASRTPSATPLRGVHVTNSRGDHGLATPRLTPSPPVTNLSLAHDTTRKFQRPSNDRLFDLEFRSSATEMRSFTLQGTLVPLHRTLVTSSLPLIVPFVKIDHEDAPTSCTVQCDGAALHSRNDQEVGSDVCDISENSIGTFQWPGGGGAAISQKLNGTVKAVLHRKHLEDTSFRLEIAILVDRSSQEIGFRLPSGYASRIQKATLAGINLKTAIGPVVSSSPIQLSGAEIRFGTKGRSGVLLASIALEQTEEANITEDPVEETRIPMAEFEGDGKLILNLRGAWDRRRSRYHGNFAAELEHTGLSFTFPFNTVPELFYRSGDVSSTTWSETRSSSWRSRTLPSWSTLLNIFFIWLLLSLGQQVQRLRTEVAFVAEETRDLRQFGWSFPQSSIVSSEEVTVPRGEDPPPDDKIPDLVTPLEHRELDLGSQDKLSLALGRIVPEHVRWTALFEHPALQSVSNGLDWLWRAVVWLIAPS
ncbi:hypothetical protein BD324DRAFT_619978 [Kockovaella imperatae]|uniref:Uncharacterized protein n=1 Tax=Kockovaella imperatae TaxID=4999 RepID=A0A1Y1UJH9_9TREE|nr:hypothetical protein BD324DRAFT_619978 [Kockovaella imperatae]ORX38208.1 hypothetical protein BD324DRAFT_619978 [Kockovaella imperatae]